MVLADESANAKFVAADLLSQAEHDELACAILVTTSMELPRKYQSLQKNLSQDYPEKRFCKSPLIIMVIFL